MPAEGLKTALLGSWLALSTLLLPSLVAPPLLPDEALLFLSPHCQRQAALGHECWACAATGGFLLASTLRLDAAERRSHFGIPLYAALVWNECLALLYTTGELRWLWTQLRRARQRARTSEEYSCRL